MIAFLYPLMSLLLLATPIAPTPPSSNTAVAAVAVPTTFIMLAHRWEGQGGYLDLNMDGTFEGSLDGKVVYYGNWVLDDTEKHMQLTNDPMDEEEFEWKFEVAHLSFDALHLQLNKDKTWALKLAD